MSDSLIAWPAIVVAARSARLRLGHSAGAGRMQLHSVDARAIQRRSVFQPVDDAPISRQGLTELRTSRAQCPETPYNASASAIAGAAKSIRARTSRGTTIITAPHRWHS